MVSYSLSFFFNGTASTEIYTLSLHDALPISQQHRLGREALEPVLFCNDVANGAGVVAGGVECADDGAHAGADRKSTRLNSSHGYISYAVFCLKKKKKTQKSCSPLTHHPPPAP